MRIKLADFSASDVLELIQNHLEAANANTCTHALGLAALQKPDIQMFVARDKNDTLMGCAALKTLTTQSGEIKSVRTAEAFLRQGVSRALMSHIESVAQDRGMSTVYLETHNTPQYAAACRLYENLNYKYCGPFGDYTQNSENVFMMKVLTPSD